MAVTVSYKGNAIIDTNDTITKTLLTSGKYCEDDITISNTHGIIPTGSISISENGTYDVTDKASAVVNMPRAKSFPTVSAYAFLSVN